MRTVAIQKASCSLQSTARIQSARSLRAGTALRAPIAQVRKSSRGSLSVNALAVGDKLPDCKLTYFNTEGQMEEISTGDLTAGKKVVLFAVPGAFTPTCSVKHLPGFIEKSDDLKSKGIDTIACVAVNDAFVMDAWGKSVGADGKVLMLADGSAVFTKALGVELDLQDKGLGVRSRRYAMLLDDGVIKALNLEEGGAFTISSAEDILSAL
uniref:Glutaredoxin-dependent peroxiredoxin n=1 Tax=Tetraselmis sp. GSL018 TaxID=582737 RepID=A0A061SAW2_9CHLO|mmetsp:Transcript_10813/g.25702  ORF Transcript_10813/g.25702 Transcript_10813/m.25702 type:complete len:210 (+) Transcript_10813:168-797(+)|eukprot:CAMPEP_0177596670 /NCGR_PEP_ID=MMETSP0419_2-20121207/11242_1 /TAXON_ID=582737 /ORGANISM="Tetraselmis sp., Strain GSL018" /LENGTH=209 /DNA_ID=CAMNT_0019088669 /DNA_START=124 /DNA_END=753 /DNA_ORIENTATION=-